MLIIFYRIIAYPDFVIRFTVLIDNVDYVLGFMVLMYISNVQWYLSETSNSLEYIMNFVEGVA